MRWYAVSQAAYRLVPPPLFRIEPERIHRLTVRLLRGTPPHAPRRALLALGSGAPQGDAALGTHAELRLADLTFRNRIGLGAGFDKDGVALRGWAALGLGFAEVGTVTPLAQPGNDAPRLFRLTRDHALVNRMG